MYDAVTVTAKVVWSNNKFVHSFFFPEHYFQQDMSPAVNALHEHLFNNLMKFNFLAYLIKNEIKCSKKAPLEVEPGSARNVRTVGPFLCVYIVIFTDKPLK